MVVICPSHFQVSTSTMRSASIKHGVGFDASYVENVRVRDSSFQTDTITQCIPSTEAMASNLPHEYPATLVNITTSVLVAIPTCENLISLLVAMVTSSEKYAWKISTTRLFRAQCKGYATTKKSHHTHTHMHTHTQIHTYTQIYVHT
jgi:hypothetical protein